MSSKSLLETLQAGAGYLGKRGVEEARLNMEHLLAHVLGCRRLELYLRFDEVLREPDLERLRDLTRRRGEGEPLQHLLGTVEFLGSELVCDHRALVPRPETEWLVEWLVQRFKSQPPCRVLDVGTGSGCIGLSLAKAWHTETLLVDVSEEALELARLNASRLGLESDVRLLRSDLFEKVEGVFDLIVANLPYIPRAEIAALSREVRRDPLRALDGGADGLEIVARLIADAPERLAPGGWLFLEIGHDQSARTVALCEAAGLTAAASLRDLSGIERFVLAQKSPADS
jgi:release factor glutamine methyltransferase